MAKKKVHILIEEEILKKLWEIALKRYPNPHKKLHILIHEALDEYVRKNL